MTPEQNVEIVKKAYADFGRGDVAALLAALDADVSWTTPASVEMPCAGAVKGVAGVADFFKSVGETWDFESFEPQQFVASGDRVMVQGHYRTRSRNTGRMTECDWVMAWTLRNGKVTAFQEYTDSALLRDALTVRAAA